MPSTEEMIREMAPFGFGSDGVFGSLLDMSVFRCQISVLEGFYENPLDDREKHERRTP